MEKYTPSVRHTKHIITSSVHSIWPQS